MFGFPSSTCCRDDRLHQGLDLEILEERMLLSDAGLTAPTDPVAADAMSATPESLIGSYTAGPDLAPNTSLYQTCSTCTAIAYFFANCRDFLPDNLATSCLQPAPNLIR